MEKRTATSNIHGVGRRKSAVARAWLRKGTGNFLINGQDYKVYFDTAMEKNSVTLPFKVLDLEKAFDADINVSGGGLGGQAGAAKLAISRALLLLDEKYRQMLRKFGLLTVDSRVKERKKYGQKAARRKFQFVKR